MKNSQKNIFLKTRYVSSFMLKIIPCKIKNPKQNLPEVTRAISSVGVLQLPPAPYI